MARYQSGAMPSIEPRILRLFALTRPEMTERVSAVKILDHTAGHQAVPDEQHDQRADGGGDEACTLLRAVMADRLTDEGRQERADDAQHGGQDEAGRIVRPRRQKGGDNACNEADDDDPDNAAHTHDCCPSLNNKPRIFLGALEAPG